MERSIRRRKKILPGGTTLQAKESLPIRERRVRLVQVREARILWREWRSSALRSAEMEAVMSTELSSMPRKVRVVVGPSVFSDFSGAFTCSHSEAIAVMLWTHSGESGGPAVKKSSR